MSHPVRDSHHNATSMRFLGTGSAFPRTVLTNGELAERLGVTEEWITTRTGIRERRISQAGDSGETPAGLAETAAIRALEGAQVSPSSIDLIVVATCTPDSTIPSLACRVQNRIAAPHAVAFDINAACSGFLYALSVVEGAFRLGRARNALIIGVDVLSKVTDWSNCDTSILFGDGAGAVVVSATETLDSSLLSLKLAGNGAENDLFEIAPGHTTMTMKGREIFKSSVKAMAALAEDALKAAHAQLSEIACIVPHQANARILEALAKRIDFPFERVANYIEKTGNTSAATIPTALDSAVRDGRIKRGDLVLFVAFGAGTTCGSAVLKW